MRLRRQLHRMISRTFLVRRLSSSANLRRTSSKYSSSSNPIQERSAINYQQKLVSDSDIVRCNIAITNHMRNGQCGAALQLFDSMTRRTSVTWNTMVSGYLSNGRFELARKMFDDMPYRDRVSWNVMISGYVKNGDLGAAKRLFDQMPHRDVVSWNAILSGYAQNGLVDEAWRVFCAMPVKNEISWNGILAAYVQNGRMEGASRLFESKGSWAMVSWNCLMGGYLKKRRFDEARAVFDRMPERDKVSWNTMISCYAQNGKMDMARKLFDESPVRDVFTWTAMVSGYVQNGMLDEARGVFDEMPEKNAISWNAIIAGYVQSKNVDLAWELFEKMPCRNISSWNTMITCFAQNNDTERARSLFDSMPNRDCISWSAIIGGYVQNGESEEALHMYGEMIRQGERMNSSSFTCILSMCADIAALELGKQIHGQVFRAGFESGCYVGNAVLAMYCKCGSIEEAYDVFQVISDKDIVSWNTIINGYARHGFGNEALKIFEEMQKAGTGPDEVTMVGVLSACSHTGLIDTGRSYFDSMTRDYGIMPNSKHYTCMIDLLGRAGRLNDAQKLMKEMPFEADAATWGALLGASRLHGNAELGEKAAEMIFAMEPWNAGMYVLLSNLYASSGRWPEVRNMRLRMRGSGVRKVPGYSWVEVQNKIHTFSVGDSTHPESKRIYAFLEELDIRLKHEGFVSSPKLVLHDVEDEEKEQMLKYHSEKLAVAFAILTIPDGRPIRVIKNLRVCEDCHTVIKLISKIVGRVIIVRDSNRFHHFRDGSCSCGDYW